MKNKLYTIKLETDGVENTIGVVSHDGQQAMCDVLNHFHGIGVTADRVHFITVEETPVLYRQQFQNIPA